MEGGSECVRVGGGGVPNPHLNKPCGHQRSGQIFGTVHQKAGPASAAPEAAHLRPLRSHGAHVRRSPPGAASAPQALAGLSRVRRLHRAEPPLSLPPWLRQTGPALGALDRRRAAPTAAQAGPATPTTRPTDQHLLDGGPGVPPTSAAVHRLHLYLAVGGQVHGGPGGPAFPVARVALHRHRSLLLTLSGTVAHGTPVRGPEASRAREACGLEPAPTLAADTILWAKHSELHREHWLRQGHPFSWP